jgi:CubicO group peptidase (beta-lactamase class C family)
MEQYGRPADRRSGPLALLPLEPAMKKTVLSRALLLALWLAAFPIARHPAGAQAAPPASAPGIAASLQPLVNNHMLAGAVTLVASKDKVLALEAVGYADVAAKRPMQTDCLFWIASMSKPITATALMMLVDEGKVNVDDAVEKYLPEFRGQRLAVEQDRHRVLLKQPRHPITVRNVLSHTSGLPFKSPMEQPTLDLLPLAEAVKTYAVSPLQFEPDSKYQYSNAGINTAGRIIEVVSGVPYEEFLAKRLFVPLGMKDTCFRPNQEQLRRLAKSYKPNEAKTGLEETTVTQLKYPLDAPTRQPMPAGGLFSTATDLSLFCRMILDGGTFGGKRYLSEKSLRQMTSPQTGPLPDGYGFGWEVDRQTGAFGHGGAYSTNMRIDPARQLVMIFLVQHAGWVNNAGKEALSAFQQAAIRAFGK